MTTYERFIHNVKLRRSAVLAGVVVLLWLVRSVMSTILLTFLFAFLVTRLVKWCQRYIRVKPVFIVAPLYLLIVLGLLYTAIHYVPVIVVESVHLFNSVLEFYNSKAFADNQAMQWVMRSVDSLNLKTQLQTTLTTVLDYATSVGAMGVTLLISLILSFFFTVESDELNAFGRTFLTSPFGWVFADLKYFADKFINTFGVVIEAQLFIALFNTVVTTITLIVMRMPYIPSLALMVFFLSMIPVAGAIISVVPLAMIAFTVDGINGVVTIIVMIIIIHVLEAYVLNPKFMSSRTKLPVFFTFVVLLAGEKLFGTWGLIVGIPVFTFLLDIMGVKKITPDPPPAPAPPAAADEDQHT